MSPTRRDVLKASAGAVATSLMAAPVVAQPVTAHQEPDTWLGFCLVFPKGKGRGLDGMTLHQVYRREDGTLRLGEAEVA